MTRVEALTKLSVDMSLEGVRNNIALVNKIFDDLEAEQKEVAEVVFPSSDGDWGRVEAVLLPEGDWIEIGSKEEEE